MLSKLARLNRSVEPVEKVPELEFKLDMRDDLPNSDVAGQLHDDLLVTWFTNSDNVGFSNDLGKGPSVNELPKISSSRVFRQARAGSLARLIYKRTIEAPSSIL